MLFQHRKKIKQQQMNPKLLFVVSVLCGLYILYLGSQDGDSSHVVLNCEAGPLHNISGCKQEHSDVSWLMPQGWRYSYAKGGIKAAVCDQLSLNLDSLSVPIAYQAKPEILKKVDCAVLQEDNTHLCYASQRLTEDAGTRFITTLTTDSHCGDAHFYRGSKMLWENGLPVKINDWQKPVAGIPEVGN